MRCHGKNLISPHCPIIWSMGKQHTLVSATFRGCAAPGRLVRIHFLFEHMFSHFPRPCPCPGNKCFVPPFQYPLSQASLVFHHSPAAEMLDGTGGGRQNRRHWSCTDWTGRSQLSAHTTDMAPQCNCPDEVPHMLITLGTRTRDRPTIFHGQSPTPLQGQFRVKTRLCSLRASRGWPLCLCVPCRLCFVFLSDSLFLIVPRPRCGSISPGVESVSKEGVCASPKAQHTS